MVSAQSDQTDLLARLYAMLRDIGPDGIGGIDVHDAAYVRYAQRTGLDDGGDVSDEDYALALLDAWETV